MIVFSRSLNVPEDAVIRILFIYQKTKRHVRQRIRQKRKRRGGGWHLSHCTTLDTPKARMDWELALYK